jgi:UDP-glucose 4-epimerase
MKAVLVTGAAGFIGSHAVLQLRSRYPGRAVICVDNNMRSRDKPFSNTGLLLYQMDVCNMTEMEMIFYLYDIDCVFHFAGLACVEESKAEPLEYYHNIVTGTNTLIRAILKRAYSHTVNFILSSTCAVYGNPTELPVSEKSQIHPISPYGVAKAMAEQILMDACDRYHDRLHGGILRYFNVVGAHPGSIVGESPVLVHPSYDRIMTVCMQAVTNGRTVQIYGDGNEERDYVHVMDLVEAHILLEKYMVEKMTGEIATFVLGKDIPRKTKDFVNLVQKITNTRIQVTTKERRGGHAERLFANSIKARIELGWVPIYSLEDAIMHQWAFVQTQRPASFASASATALGEKKDAL